MPVAKVSLSRTRSTATTEAAPASTAPCTTDSPTPPQPTTATVDPGGTRAVLMTAPTPVVTAQPTRAATSSGSDESIGTTDRSNTSVRSAKVAVPTPASNGFPSHVA